jgi:hypothetical protein
MANQRRSIEQRLGKLGAKPLSAEDHRYLISLGIPGIYLDQDCRGNVTPLMKISAVFSDDGRWFAYDKDGEAAFIFEIDDPFSGTKDAVVFRPNVKGVAFLENIPALLGMNNLFDRTADYGLIAHGDALSFIKAGRSGILIVGCENAADLLRGLDSVFFEDRRQALAVSEASQLQNIVVLNNRGTL